MQGAEVDVWVRRLFLSGGKETQSSNLMVFQKAVRTKQERSGQPKRSSGSLDITSYTSI